jgi:hypothetical protein
VQKEKLDVAVELWGRQDCDNEDSWAAFLEYRDQKPPRRLHKVRKNMEERQKWFFDNCWEIRVQAYDNYLDAAQIEAKRGILAQKTEEITAEHMSLLNDLREAATIAASKWLQMEKESDAPYILRVSDLTKLVDAVIKNDRLVRGETTDKTETKIDLSDVPLENLRAARELLLKKKE